MYICVCTFVAVCSWVGGCGSIDTDKGGCIVEVRNKVLFRVREQVEGMVGTSVHACFLACVCVSKEHTCKCMYV